MHCGHGSTVELLQGYHIVATDEHSVVEGIKCDDNHTPSIIQVVSQVRAKRIYEKNKIYTMTFTFYL